MNLYFSHVIKMKKKTLLGHSKKTFRVLKLTNNDINTCFENQSNYYLVLLGTKITFLQL